MINSPVNHLPNQPIMSKFQTPGVYINENNAFPDSIVAVATGVPVFIGYTDKAEKDGKSLIRAATRIDSLEQYNLLFGGGFKARFKVMKTAQDVDDAAMVFETGSEPSVLQIANEQTAYLYNAVRMFFANGGGACYILPVATYGGTTALKISITDFTDPVGQSVLDVLEMEQEPSIIVVPDIIHLGKEAYRFYQMVLAHCEKVQNRFAIFDLAKSLSMADQEQAIQDFRDGISTVGLNYGAAYHPWVNATILGDDEVDFENFTDEVNLGQLLSDADGAGAVSKSLGTYNAGNKNAEDKAQLHNALMAGSPFYTKLVAEIRRQLNQLPPAGAIAGVYAAVDNSKGVWKAPANVSLSSVTSPVFNVDDELQAKLNVDEVTGKSINTIRSFEGLGTLIWGGRTLEGNSQDWRYINVRRTMIMIEESIKLAARAYVFEPNDANTWLTVKSMMDNFLTGLWQQGALAGATPQDAFGVQIGLGSTMTPGDILDGKMRITVLVAVAKPAEFIEITFEQQMQKS